MIILQENFDCAAGFGFVAGQYINDKNQSLQTDDDVAVNLADKRDIYSAWASLG